MLDMALWAQILLGCGNGVDSRLLDIIAIQESSRNPAAVHHNKNGTDDVGAMGINQVNWDRFNLNRQTAQDPCRSVDAGSRHILADAGPEAVKPEVVDALYRALHRYNPGDPLYPNKVMDRLPNASVSTPTSTSTIATAPAMPKRTLANQFPTFGGSH